MGDITERVKKIVVEQLNVEEPRITEETSFIDDLGADSLDMAELVMAFEAEFKCEISDEIALSIKTIKDAITYLEQQESKAS